MNTAPLVEREALAGLVERVTFHNADSGFCVLRVKVRGQRDLVTVVGAAAAISAGEFIQASGTWRERPLPMGCSSRPPSSRPAPPTTLEGIERYLGSGMIRGIGPIYARKLVQTFGEAVFDAIEQAPERLQEVAGIGPKRSLRIRRRLGRTEGDPRDHAVPAQPWCRHLARRADLQDLRRGCRAGHLGEPLPPRP